MLKNHCFEFAFSFEHDDDETALNFLKQFKCDICNIFTWQPSQFMFQQLGGGDEYEVHECLC